MRTIDFRHGNNKIHKLSPTRIIIISFGMLILIGTLLLLLPAASKSGKSMGLLDALFTATSASCVTGLFVVDTYNHFSIFGQLVILSLIQIGGLGILTLASFFSVLLGKKMSLRGMILAQESVNYFNIDGVIKLIRYVVIITLSFEFLGFLILSTVFVPQFGAKGYYIAVFHAISGFCNAGFDLMGILGNGDFVSLTFYNDNPVVIYTMAMLIIIGSVGFLVWKDIIEFRFTRKIFLHTKMVLAVSAALIITGAALYFLYEYDNPATMGSLSLPEKINAAVFQSIALRTAGFNSISVDNMSELSKFTTILLMFVGAAPGSTAGGIKVTTFGVILFAVISLIKGSNETIIFKRKIASTIVIKSMTIALLSAAVVFVVTVILLAIEGMSFINVLFEVTSAFGTVGISTGITPSLHFSSKLLLVMTMFLGKVGPISFAIALSLKFSEKENHMAYPDGKILVG